MSSSSSRLNLRQLSCWLQVILLAWGMGSMVQPVSASQVLPRLETETVTDPEQGTTVTAYAYDAANNRASKTVQGGSEPGFWQYDYNVANQLVSWRKLAGPWGTLLKEATLGYDANGNRSEQRVTDVATLTAAVTQYSWDAQDRLSAVEMPDGQVHGYEYDYRTRRMGISRAGGQQGGGGTVTAVVFSGGLSLAEWETTGNSEPGTENPPSVHYTRGPDMGGGVGGLLYSRRGETLKYNLSNGRGDIVAQSDAAGALTWTASYEAYGKRTKETGENTDKQRANTKDEDPTGLLNEGFRYRDLETGVWLSRDPAGFVDGPNLYAYVKQNPWTSWDPDGLKSKSDYRRDMVRAAERRSADLNRLPSNASDRARFGIENRYQKAMRKAQQGIDGITATARSMEAVTRSQTGSINDEFLDDEDNTYTSFNRISMLGAVLPMKFGEHVHCGEYGAAAQEFGKEALIAVAFAGMGKAIAAAGRLAPAADDTAKFVAQGFSREQAAYLAQTYEGMGHHFMPRRWGLPGAITESNVNVLKPPGMSRGSFYELHYTVDPKFFGTRLPAAAGGGTWSGAALGLQKASGLNRVWQAAPFELKNAVGSGAASSLYSNGQ